ncbi:MAG TPA: DJ-1/PfpI family protein [Actinophytocola sp.]|uniref:DJ-1/PfpI family protein n=1 Tax=Actinophytocola sp. TaxID=1872138 RepID=UPI002DFE2349|nr:DJ-1/PfpI family protein [Actinophytocola sp.]
MVPGGLRRRRPGRVRDGELERAAAATGHHRTVVPVEDTVASVCTGSLILAAGLLEGRNATTHWALADQLNRLGAQ